MEHFPITSWQISIAQILFTLPLYVLIYPLARRVCKHALHGGRKLLYAYPYAVSLMVLMGFTGMAVMFDKLTDHQIDVFLVLGYIKLLPFMVACNIWTQRYLERKKQP